MKWYRLKYWLFTLRDYPAVLNRCATVEQRLYDSYRGKRPLPTKEDCKEMFRILGTGKKD